MNLDNLAIEHGTDKSSNGHWYTRHYQEFFSLGRTQIGAVLEVGIGSGASLKVWRDYFPNAWIYGMDFNPMNEDLGPRVKTYIVDQTDCEGITNIFKFSKLEIIIEDASHDQDKTFDTLDCLFPLLNPRGWYVIEDMDWNGFPERIGKWITKNVNQIDRYYVLGNGGYGRPGGACIIFIQKQP